MRQPPATSAACARFSRCSSTRWARRGGPMRVTPGSIQAQMTRDLQAALAALSRQQSRVAANRRILTPSDDPGGAAQSLGIRSRQAAVAQFQKNVAAARSSLPAGEGALGSVSEVVTPAIEAAVQGAN